MASSYSQLVGLILFSSYVLSLLLP